MILTEFIQINGYFVGIRLIFRGVSCILTVKSARNSKYPQMKGGIPQTMLPTHRKLIALAMAAVLTFAALDGQVCALQYTGTDSYMSGRYYRKLQQVKLTGDPRTDIVAIARSQVGYQEGGSVNQLSGEVHGGVNFTEYGGWYGVQDMWCAMFVSWCAAQAGISTDTVPSHCNTPEGMSWFAERGRAYSRAEVQSRKYTPRPGDLVYFKSSRNAKITNHVGIITGYANNRIYTIEGNIGAPGKLTNGGMVAEQSYPISNTYIVFICAPDYEAGSTNILPDADEKERILRLESLRNAMITVEAGEGLRYDAVHTDPTGRVTLGCGQWYGAHAVQLLRRIWEEDETVFRNPDVAGMISGTTLPRLNEQQCEILGDALRSEVGIRIQNEWMDRNLEAWMARAATLGVTDRDGLLLCAAIYQLRGSFAAEQIITEAGDAPTKEALLNSVKDLEPGLYRTCCLLVE